MRLHDMVGEMFTAPLWQFVQTTELATLAMYTREGASPPAAFYAAQRFCERKHAPFTAVEGTRFQFVTAYSANPKVLKRDLATDLEEFTRLAGLGQARVHYGMAFKSVMGRFVALLKPIVPDIESRFQLTLERLDEYLKQVPPAPLTEEQLRPKDWCDPEADGALEIDLAGPLDPQRAEAALLERLDPELHAEVREGKRKPEGVDFTAGWTEHSRMLRETTEERSLGMALALPASQYSAQENAQANGFELRRDSVDIDVAQAFDPDCKAPAPKKKPPKPKPEPPLSMPLSMVEMAARGIDDAAPAPEATLNQLVAQTIAIDQVHTLRRTPRCAATRATPRPRARRSWRSCARRTRTSSRRRSRRRPSTGSLWPRPRGSPSRATAKAARGASASARPPRSAPPRAGRRRRPASDGSDVRAPVARAAHEGGTGGRV